MTDLAVHTTGIPGLLIVDLPVHGDERGWFKENWQRAKMTALGLPDFGPVQQNVSFNAEAGVTRGVHAEPWDKYVSVATGRVFGAWVDLREGSTFGTVVTAELGPSTAVFVPAGVGNAFQSLEPTAYTYLVNDHWSEAARNRYTFVNLADPVLGIEWPIPLDRSVRSEADLAHPLLTDVTPMRAESDRAQDAAGPGRVLVLGAGGQLGTELLRVLPGAVGHSREHTDLAAPEQVAALDLAGFDAVINAAAYTQVDAAETDEGRQAAWAVNATGVAALVRAAQAANVPLVHVSSDYVFDGTRTEHDEDEPFSPLGVYGQSKAAGDIAVATYEKHYLVRTSWVIGEGNNFVRTMASLAERGVEPTVVDDQHGRLSFTEDIAAGVVHLLTQRAPYGTYNLTNTGPVQTWAQIAADVYELCGRDRAAVTPVSTAEYGKDKNMAPRPVHSALRLDKIVATGFTPAPAAQRLREALTDHAPLTKERW